MNLYDKLILSIDDKDCVRIKELVNKNFPIDIANTISELEEDALKDFAKCLSFEEISEIIEVAEEELQTSFINILPLNSIIEIFSFMSSDDIADILGILPIDKRKDFLKLMKASDSKDVQMLLGFDEESAGGIMTTQYIALFKELSVGQALEKIKRIGPKTEVIETIFIIDKNNRLLGTVDLRDILISENETKLAEILDENFLFVHPDTDQEEVSLIVSKYDLQVIPVLNRKNVLLGIITIDDIVDVIVEEQAEDFAKLSGVDKDEKVGSKLSVSIKSRLPWLMINLITAFLASFTVSMFEDTITQVVALAAAMPIVAGMGGNAGTQTLSIVVRSIALGEVDIKEDWKYVFNEILLGVINGLITGLVTGIILFVKYDNIYLGIIILVAMIGNLVIAGFFGFLIPLILKKFNLDPAISSSIFLTTATDVGGFFIFLGLAQMFLEYLI